MTRTLVRYGWRATSPPDPTSHAADLAEAILEQISNAEQDWSQVAELARTLAEVAASAAAPSEPPMPEA